MLSFILYSATIISFLGIAFMVFRKLPVLSGLSENEINDLKEKPGLWQSVVDDFSNTWAKAKEINYLKRTLNFTKNIFQKSHYFFSKASSIATSKSKVGLKGLKVVAKKSEAIALRFLNWFGNFLINLFTSSRKKAAQLKKKTTSVKKLSFKNKEGDQLHIKQVKTEEKPEEVIEEKEEDIWADIPQKEEISQIEVDHSADNELKQEESEASEETKTIIHQDRLQAVLAIRRKQEKEKKIEKKEIKEGSDFIKRISFDELEKPIQEEQQFIDEIIANPKNITAYKNLGHFYWKRSNLNDAKASFEMVIKLGSTDKRVKKILKEIEEKNLAK